MSALDSTEPPNSGASIVFLLYENRSGSTYLASRLAALPRTVVTIESENVGAVLDPSEPVATHEALERVLDDLYAEKKFNDWGIARETLQHSLVDVAFPIARDVLFLHILRCLPGGADGDCFVVKVPGIKRRFFRLLERYPQFRGIHIYRDPRAVYASQQRSISSRTGRPMVRDPITAARRWTAAVHSASELPEKAVFEVRYEDVVANEKQVIDALKLFLGRREAPASEDSGGADYASRIPAAQRHLHTRVAGDADSSRIGAWANELAPGEVYILERVCGDAMRKRGYEFSQRFSIRHVFAVLPRVLANWAQDLMQRAAARFSSRRSAPLANEHSH